MYRIWDNQDCGLFENLVFSTLDKALEYATNWYADHIGPAPGQWPSINAMEESGEIGIDNVFLDPDPNDAI
jgi:hypothetical protein